MVLALVTLRGGAIMAGGARGDASDTPPPVATYGSSALAFLASVTGDVVVEDGCLLLRAEGRSVLPIFPSAEVDWRDGRLVCMSREYAPGDSLELQGGFVPGEGCAELSVPQGCPTDVVTFVVAPHA
jgi:hypothetical protein